MFDFATGFRCYFCYHALVRFSFFLTINFILNFLDNFYNDEAGSDQWKRSGDSQRVDFGEMMKRALEDDDFMLR